MEQVLRMTEDEINGVYKAASARHRRERDAMKKR